MFETFSPASAFFFSLNENRFHKTFLCTTMLCEVARNCELDCGYHYHGWRWAEVQGGVWGRGQLQVITTTARGVRRGSISPHGPRAAIQRPRRQGRTCAARGYRRIEHVTRAHVEVEGLWCVRGWGERWRQTTLNLHARHFFASDLWGPMRDFCLKFGGCRKKLWEVTARQQ